MKDEIKQTVSLIPDVYYDISARIVPGLVLLLALHWVTDGEILNTLAAITPYPESGSALLLGGFIATVILVS